jgi:hypothetical protein
VWRQGENGHHFLVKAGLREAEALELVRDYEQKGHQPIINKSIGPTPSNSALHPVAGRFPRRCSRWPAAEEAVGRAGLLDVGGLP